MLIFVSIRFICNKFHYIFCLQIKWIEIQASSNNYDHALNMTFEDISQTFLFYFPVS